MMSFAAPEFIPSSNPKTCVKCGKHVNNARAISWEDNICPWCYEFKVKKQDIDNSNPLDTVVNAATVNPMTVYLDRYTHSEMKMMKN